ncbi:hypothetical protein [Clostridium sp. KNHs214]|uniref:hypothetical protein n=1 Tax=Clostridium sp. KNHs214 TaxID=1540257 RepID=UPI000556529B|nr:hypothetical protein [Clostridium sp. KNHs214]
MWLFLILIGAMLIVLNLGAIKKEKNSFDNILLKKENNTKEYEVELYRMRSEFKEEIDKLEKDIEELKEKLEYNNSLALQNVSSHAEYYKEKNQNSNLQSQSKTDNVNELVVENNKIDNNFEKKQEKETDGRNKSIRVLEMEELLRKGFTIDQVAQKLNISKGEALLIKDLYLR